MNFEYKDYELSNAITDIAAGPFGSNLKVSCFTTTGFPIIDGANLKEITVTDNITKFVPEDKARSLHRSIAKRRDVVVTISGNVGQVSYIPDNSQYAEYLCSQRQFRVTFDESKIYVPYLVYYLHSVEGQSKILAFANQTGVPALSQPLKNFRKIKIDLPSLAEQKKIAAILSALDEKIAINREINDNLEQQAQALFKSWFVDFDPYDEIMPSDWINGTVDDLAKEIVCGKTPSTKVSEYYGSDIPFITIPDMHGKIYTVATERYLSICGANSQAKKTLPKNAICVSCIGTAGLVTLVASPSQTNQQINSIIPKDDFSPYYIYLLMQTLSEVINKLGQSGSTIVNLNKAQFGKIKVCIPTVTTMKGFDGIVAPLFTMILRNQKENICLSSLQETLLPKLMSGEIDVSAVQL